MFNKQTHHSITEHVYAADGRRLKTIHRTSIPQSNPLGIGVTASLTPAQTQSIDSIDYVGSFIYEKGQLKRYMFDDGYLKLYTNTFSPRFFIKDHLGNNRIVTDGSGNIQQNTNYYPYGGMTSISTGQGEQQFKYNGKEYDPMHGLNEYGYGARQYDPAIGKFTTMDPLCEKYYHISPYAYCGGNPVNAVDVDGRKIKIVGEMSTMALQQLQSRVGKRITLSLNANNMLTYTVNDKRLKGDALKLANIIDDEIITVNLETPSIDKDFNFKYSGGAFMGNVVNKDDNDFISSVDAYQCINPQKLDIIDKYMNESGMAIFHETTEAYEGARLSMINKQSSPPYGEIGSVYERAHYKASSQSGIIRLIDLNNDLIRKYSLPSEAKQAIVIYRDYSDNDGVVINYYY